MKLSKATLTAFNLFIHYLSPSAFEAFASSGLVDVIVLVGNTYRSADSNHDIQMCGPSYMAYQPLCNTYMGSV